MSSVGGIGRGLTVENVDRDGGLRVAHAARVVAGVALRRARDLQAAHGAVLQQVSPNAETRAANRLLVASLSLSQKR